MTTACLKAMLATTTLLITLTGLLGCGSNPRALPVCRGKVTLAASGSSAQAEAIAGFNRAYSTACPGRSVDYTSNGSAAGRAEFLDGQTDFAGSDFPIGRTTVEAQQVRARCGGNEAWNLPMVFGAIAVIYNVAGAESLVLDAATIAKIFKGSIRAWDAPEIAALNPHQALPSSPIVVIARGDESGTTAHFQDDLRAAAGPAWGTGTGEAFTGIAQERGVGNEGTWSAMRHSPGSITYTAWPFAKKNGLPTASIVTSAGPEPVVLNLDSVGKSIAAMKATTRGNDIVVDTASLHVPTRTGAYPIVMTTYETVCSTYRDRAVSAALREFLTIALNEGQEDLADSGYVPIPESVRNRLRVSISAIS